MTNKNLHEDSSCPVDQDVPEESTEEILDEVIKIQKMDFQNLILVKN